MSIDLGNILGQIDSVLERWEKVSAHAKYDDYSDLPDEEVSKLITLFDATIDKLSPLDSTYRKNTRALISRYGEDNSSILGNLAGVLSALRNDYEAGYLQSIQELIHGEVFSDFLEMAEYLLQEGYKDPSAVMVGGVSEEHLRKLAQKNGIQITEKSKLKKADKLNSELASARVYSKLDQKSVTTWLDPRNKAAHGKYSEYTKEQVSVAPSAFISYKTINMTTY